VENSWRKREERAERERAMSGTIEVADAVRESFTGELIGPADPPYEQARRVHNGLINKRPALIARCRVATAFLYRATRWRRSTGGWSPIR
jgi:hypothetical protein